MDIAKHLALIELLCAREFPAAHGRTERGESGPGYHIAVLQRSGDFWEDDGTESVETWTQYEADRDALGERLGERWGEAQRFSLYSVLIRTLEGEEIEEPWAGLCQHTVDLDLWRSTESGRWVVLGVSQGDKELPIELVVAVTDRDPP